MPPVNPARYVVRLSDVCREVDLSPATMRRLCKDGRGPPMRPDLHDSRDACYAGQQPHVASGIMAGHRADDFDARIGARIAHARRLAGLSQGALGAATGVTAAQVTKYERGRNRISASHLARIAKVLKMPIGAFFDPPDDDAAFEALLSAAVAYSGSKDPGSKEP